MLNLQKDGTYLQWEASNKAVELKIYASFRNKDIKEINKLLSQIPLEDIMQTTSTHVFRRVTMTF